MDLNFKITTKNKKSFYDVQFNTTNVTAEINQGAHFSFQLKTPSIVKEQYNSYETKKTKINDKLCSKIHCLVLESTEYAQTYLVEEGVAETRWFPKEGLHVVVESDCDKINLVSFKRYLKTIICLMYRLRTEN